MTYRVPLIRKDGAVIELELHARRIDWDEGPADIVVVDDITRKEEAGGKDRGYMQRLENSMKATSARSRRWSRCATPYTAGHESRVGRIARRHRRGDGLAGGAVRAPGDDRLVHDVGKIAVPAEILTKPAC